MYIHIKNRRLPVAVLLFKLPMIPKALPLQHPPLKDLTVIYSPSA